MLNLIQNEWMKLWQRKSTWITVIIFTCIVIAMLVLVKVTDTKFNSEESLQAEQKELVQVERKLDNPDLSDDERESLEEEQEYLTYSIQSFNPSTRESIIFEAYGVMSLVTLMTIIVASGIVSSEFTQGTIKMLLSRPVKRWKILLSKFVTVLLYSLLLTVILVIVNYVMAYALFPAANTETIDFYGKGILPKEVIGKSLYMILLGWINTIVVATLAFMIGTIFRSTSLAIGISIFLYFTGNTIVLFLTKYDFAKYILFANTNLTQYITGYALIEDLTMRFSLIVIGVYMVCFSVLSFIAFIKRDVAA